MALSYQNHMLGSTNTTTGTLVNKRGLGAHIDVSNSFTPGQVTTIQVIASVLALISLSCSSLACYLFSRMKKKFRHKLIILLIVGDVVRATWFFVFPLVSLTHGRIHSDSPLCQASGFFTQLGTEMADYAILVIAVHTALQVFRPSVTLQAVRSETGLYRYRYAVYAGAATIPPTFCSLSFIRGKGAFLSQGPLCSLPVRPFWYRLALSWIPRYIIICVVGGLYMAIYIHTQAPSSRWKRIFGRSESPMWETVTAPKKRRQQSDGTLEISPFDEIVRLSSRDRNESITEAFDIAKSTKSERTVSGTTIAGSLLHDNWSKQLAAFGRRGTVCTMSLDGTVESTQIDSGTPNSSGSRSSVNNKGTQETDIIGRKIVTEQMQAKQNKIQRQLRLLLAYPLTYLLIWTFPFISHACNYDDYLVQHPIFVLVLLSYISLTSMGTVNSLMFCLKEKPWRHIRGSDGTFLGSFMFWKHNDSRRASELTDSTYSDDRGMSICSWGMSQQMSMSMDSFTPRIGSISGPQGIPARHNSVSAARVHEMYGFEEMLAASARRPSQLHPFGSAQSNTIDFAVVQPRRHSRWQPRGSLLEIPKEEEIDRELDMIDRQIDNTLMRQEISR